MPTVTVPEAARFAGRNPETIRRWIREGKLNSEKVGTQYLVRTEDIEALIPHQPLELPEHWGKADDGPMPPWEQLVHAARGSH